MTGKLDEVSKAIGELQSDVRHLGERMDAFDKLQQARHGENQRAIASVVAAVRAGNGLGLTKRQRLALVALGLALLGIAGWLAEVLLGSGASWLISHLRLGDDPPRP